MRRAVSLLALVTAAFGTLADGALAQTNHVSSEASRLTEATRAHPGLWPHAASPSAMSDARTEAFVEDLLARMTLEEKVGQLIQGDIASITPADLARYPLGLILAGGNSSPGGNERASAQAWVDLARAFRAASAARPAHACR